jgi:hypothetical protein
MKRSSSVGLCLAAMAGGLALGVALAPDTTGPMSDDHVVAAGLEPQGPRHDGEAVGPGATRAGMLVGFDRTEPGARDAALAYATAPQRWLYMDDASIRAAVAAIATETAAERLAGDVVEEVGLARDALAASPGRVWWFVRPLASDVVMFSRDRARVEVWVVTVLSASDVAVPQADWLTVSLELRWEGDDWRVDDVRDEPGPTPMSGTRDEPWAPEPFDDALAGFERVDWEVP